jgi:hypothetical protein
MKIINKIAVLISWPRELDMFSAFISNTVDNVIIIVDNFIYDEGERLEKGKSIIELLDGKMEYMLLSEVLGKSFKYKVLFSTGGQTFQKKVTFRSYLKYIYAVTIGSFIEHFKLSNFFLETVGHSLTGGGKYAEKFGKYPIERIVGDTVIKYPKGLDINKANYPEDQWKDVFDIYLCHSNIDQNLINDKFPDAKCIKIGYPRYDNMPSIKHSKSIIYDEIKSINASKPLLLWMPTMIKIRGELIDNIKVWAPTLEKLLDKYNILIRVHPKMLVMDAKISDYLTGLGFLVDIKKGRNLGVLYQASDLIFADYGGSVLSAIYMKKKLILLNSSSRKYLHWRRDRMYVDDDVRKDVHAFSVNNGAALNNQVNKSIQNNNVLKRDSFKKQYFGEDCNYEYLRDFFLNL